MPCDIGNSGSISHPKRLEGRLSTATASTRRHQNALVSVSWAPRWLEILNGYSADSGQDFPRLVLLRHPEESLSSQAHELHDRLVRQRTAMRASRCPTCDNESIKARGRWQQRQDLTTVWLHLNGNTIRAQRHCVACQPHGEPLILSNAAAAATGT